MTNQAEVEQKMIQLKLDYLEKLPQKIDSISDGWVRLKKEWQRKDAEDLYREIHSLCGSSASYGGTGVNRHARGLEQALLAVIYDDRPPNDEEIETIELLLRRTIKASSNWIAQNRRDMEVVSRSGVATMHPSKIFILEEDYLASPLSRQLAEQGFSSEVFADSADLLRATKTSSPLLIIADLQLLGSAASKIRSEEIDRPPLIILSNDFGLDARIQVARTGAERFLQKPIDISRMVREVRRIAEQKSADSYRVLIVDDDRTISELHQRVLQNSGLQTRVLNDPRKGLEVVAEYKPDLVLMDVHMPDCSGPELAAMIGQDYRFTDLPILFLSADTNIETTLNELQLAGEDYLTKPVDPKWLVASVVARIRKRQDLVQAQESYRKAFKENRYRELALNEHAIVSIADASGVITYVNKKFCDVSGYTKEELLGQDHNLINSGRHSAEFFEKMWETISSGEVWHGEICNLRKDGSNYWVSSTIVPFLDDIGIPYQYVSMRTDVTPIKSLELEVSRHAELLDSLHQAMTGFMSAGQFNNVVNVLLENILSLTHSQYGIMAEVLFDDGEPVLKAHAVYSRLWDESTSSEYDLGFSSGITLERDHALLREVARSGEIRVINDLDSRSKSDSLPGGDEHLKKAIAVPVFYGDQLVGVYAFARSDKDYSDNIISFLDALNSTYGVMIHAKRIAEMEEEVNFYLEQARKDAESANRSKSEFLSSMSHELRTPLNVILGFAQLMASDADVSDSNRENADEILRAGRHLLDLVNEILDLSRIESGQIDLSIEPVEIEAVIADGISLVSTLATNKNIMIEYKRNTCKDTRVLADVTRLNQALINYLSNAIKYTPINGSVSVSCSRTDQSMLRILVSDSGPGIPGENINQLYTSFNRLGAEESGVEGTGIGLVITKSLIENMDGSVGYHQSDLGGAGFWLELPIYRDTRTSGESVTDIEIRDEPREERDEEVLEIFKLLYIEDNQANLNLVKQLISRRSNMDLVTAQEPETGLRILQQTGFDAVLLDINLPVMSGYEVLAFIRENESTCNLPVIALSANAMPDDIERGLKAGFDDYITKPIQIDQFFEVLDRTFRKD